VLSTRERVASDIDSRAARNRRFLNHSHAPNLRLEPVYRSPAHRTVPRIAFFAARDLTEGEELVWDYGCGAAVSEPNDSGQGRTRCACGAEACDGWLPYDASL
jgi:SET domain-containing protein